MLPPLEDTILSESSYCQCNGWLFPDGYNTSYGTPTYEELPCNVSTIDCEDAGVTPYPVLNPYPNGCNTSLPASLPDYLDSICTLVTLGGLPNPCQVNNVTLNMTALCGDPLCLNKTTLLTDLIQELGCMASSAFSMHCAINNTQCWIASQVSRVLNAACEAWNCQGDSVDCSYIASIGQCMINSACNPQSSTIPSCSPFFPLK